MPDNKKHHYVPRFYLKRFSNDELSISLWNIKNQIKVPSSNLRNQCYKNYFYGKDLSIEKSLGDMEGRVAEIFRQIDSRMSLPRFSSQMHLELIVYMLIQLARTAYSADAVNDMYDRMFKHTHRSRAANEGIDLDQFSVGFAEPAQYAIQMYTKLYPLMLDLNRRLLINESEVDFVTSDNPVVLYNQLLEFNTFGSNTGLASKGLQIFLPISSRLMLVFFDHTSYSVGRRSWLTVRVTSPRDVYELNALQMANAYENVYFESSDFDAEALFRKADRFRRSEKSSLSVYEGDTSRYERNELVAVSRKDVKTNLKLSFIRASKGAKKWRIEQRKRKLWNVRMLLRNYSLFKDHEEFLKKVDEGEFEIDQFLYFLKHYGKTTNLLE